MALACRVLIVDDELLVRQGIKHLLNWEQEGFQIIGEASNGKEALELIEREEPHIVITDIVMPVMGGEELTRAIKSRFPQIEVIILSSFGEFDYVRSTFQSGVADYILKPKLEAFQLLDIVKRTARKIPSLKLEEGEVEGGQTIPWILDKLMSGYEIELDENRINQSFPHDIFQLIGTDLKQAGSKGSERGEELQWMERILSALDEYLPDAVHAKLPAEPDMLVLLVNMNHTDKDGLTSVGRRLAEYSRAHYPARVWTISEPFLHVKELGSNYKEQFIRINLYQFFLPLSQHLIIYDELPSITNELQPFNMNQFTELMNRRQFDTAFGELLEHVNRLAANYQTDVFEFKSFVGNVIFNITILLSRLDSDMKKLEESKYSYFKQIGEAGHASSAIALLHSFIAEANDVIEKRSVTGSNSNMTQLLLFIREHYADPLSLTELAKHFHFNPSYLSSYFTSHNKEGFSEYLNKIRVEKAAELLEDVTASISEISSLVGYSDHSYFTKVFKKVTGLSPSHYRKQYAAKKRD
ncbi:two-component system response regulator YesN [Paenibacillus endophyticus]|uniref:Two-component system response regulator YesN n=1 Tax=Paenibacillus endophyticus TaxID=1294268 RepID=A0A7W5GBP4_9BACL|nr:response regulator transcription factor [Paenibacillus endophyticus]MBB3153132.1 two-component system response regulator YesN [Paenibacillus endophyticus]